MENKAANNDKEKLSVLKNISDIFSMEDIDENGVYRVPDNYDTFSPDAFYNFEVPEIKKIVFGSRVKSLPGKVLPSLALICKEIDLSQTQIKELKAEFQRFAPVLEKIVLPKTLTSIGPRAFLGCELKTVEFHKDTQLQFIGEEAFIDTSIEKIVIPDNGQHIVIGNRAFGRCDELKEVVLPKDCILMRQPFYECHNLGKIKIPDYKGVEFEEAMFSSCSMLEKIVIPEGYKFISSEMFANCSCLREVTLPESVTSIYPEAFRGCPSLKHINLPKSLETIQERAFYQCDLDYLELPEGLKRIGNMAFAKNFNLREIIIPNSVELMGKCCFENCASLERIVLPDNMVEVKDLGSGLYNLKEVVFPKNLKSIGYAAFIKSSLEHVDIPKTLEIIEDKAFSRSNLKEFIMPEGALRQIYSDAFSGCENLKKVVLPEGVETIFGGAFSGCAKLKEINFPQSLRVLYWNAFRGCTSLEHINIEGWVTIKGAAFSNCQNLKTLTIKSGFIGPLFDAGEKIESLQEIKLGEQCNFCSFESGGLDYLTFEDGYFHFTKEPINEDSLNLQFVKQKKLYLSCIMTLWDDRKLLQKLLAEDNMVAELLNMVYIEKGKSGLKTFFDENKNNLKFFRQLKIDTTVEDQRAFCKLYYNLGGFEPNHQEVKKGKDGSETIIEVNYAQKVGEFLKEFAKTHPQMIKNSYENFGSMGLSGFKKDFTDFMLNKKNFEDVIAENKNYRNFLSTFYDYFNDVQKLNTSNKGSQRQLKPTIKAARLFILGNTFRGVTEENMHLAMAIRQFFTMQETFDNALEIVETKNRNHVGDQILKEPLFEKIEETSQNIVSTAADTLNSLGEIASNKYTFEMLSKSDPANFILGKLCNCCAHLEGVGYGIMKASIVRPDVQNIVIRDENGTIVAKSTLYINTAKGYGICNNFEINNSIDTEDFQIIKEKLLKAISEFAKQYNKDYPERKRLTQINVGISNNDLLDWFEDEEIIEDKDKLLQSIQYSEYGQGWNNYNGDSSYGQIEVWHDNEKE